MGDTMGIRLATAAVLLLAGCGQAILISPFGPEDMEDPPGLPQQPPPSGDGGESPTDPGIPVDLRLRANTTEEYSRLLLVVRRVAVRIDSQPAAVEQLADVVELAGGDHAERIASFVVPTTAKMVEVTLVFGEAGGFEGAGVSGWIDSRHTLLRFKATAKNLAMKNKATVVLDAPTALLRRDVTTLAFVPRFRVSF